MMMLVFVLITSCEQEPVISYGFNSPITENSRGLAVADISKTIDLIYLNGYIRLNEGEVELSLTNPKGATLFTRKVTGPGELIINETFTASPGYWKLKYNSIEGIGNIDLHINR